MTQTRLPIEPQDAYVLIVEDNADNMVLIARLLMSMGIKKHEWISSGWQVLEAAGAMERLDLVLMDIHLPHEDGYDALYKLKADPRFANARIVAVTADANRLTLEEARQAGFDGFLGKPINPDIFPEHIRATLQGDNIWDLGA